MSTFAEYNIDISSTNQRLATARQFRVVTTDPGSHINIGVPYTQGGEMWTMSKPQAVELRDVLSKLYPAPRPKPQSFIDYVLQPAGGGKWDLVRRHLGVHHHPVGRFNNETEARIALSAFEKLTGPAS